MAATIGSSAFLNCDSSPLYSSRSSSKPMKRKKIAISPSLIQCSRLKPPAYPCHTLTYIGPNDAFAIASESIVQITSTIPLDFSEWKNLLNMSDRCSRPRLIVVTNRNAETGPDSFYHRRAVHAGSQVKIRSVRSIKTICSAHVGRSPSNESTDSRYDHVE